MDNGLVAMGMLAMGWWCGQWNDGGHGECWTQVGDHKVVVLANGMMVTWGMLAMGWYVANEMVAMGNMGYK